MQSVRNQLHKTAMERLITAYAENPVIVRLQPVDTPLCSAALLANLSRHELVRNMEGGDALPVIRKMLSVVEPTHAMWRYEHHQDHRVRQYKEGVGRIDRRLRALDIIGREGGLLCEAERAALLKKREQFQLVIDHCRPVVKGTLHPNGLPPTTTNTTTNGNTTQTQTTQSQTQSEKLFDGWRIRGIHVRLAGPKKATKAGQWRRSAGAISLNSYDYVDGEHANVQIPSRTGTYGLTVRVVWALAREARRACGLRAVYGDGVTTYSLVDGHRLR